MIRAEDFFHNDGERRRYFAIQAAWDREVRARGLQAMSSNMNNTKWRELFTVLYDHGIRTVVLAFVGSEPHPHRLPDPAEEIQEGTFGCFHPLYKFGQIDWIEIDASLESDVGKALALLGAVPMIETRSGLRIEAYSW